MASPLHMLIQGMLGPCHMTQSEDTGMHPGSEAVYFVGIIGIGYGQKENRGYTIMYRKGKKSP